MRFKQQSLSLGTASVASTFLVLGAVLLATFAALTTVVPVS